MEKEFFANFRHARLVEVLKIEVNEGDGTPDDPIYRVAYLVSKDGKVLGKIGSESKRKFEGDNEMITV